ncbi:MAG TPA: NAD(P)-dependent alcohol dehydrogenase [Gemmatimonadaceae bacterium]|nr:NAD(P)-dependent alcohol dehydrogenase [Gemmatimonadaceae bacterium]
MKAFVIREPFGIGALQLVERPVPQPGPGQVLVRMKAVALNYRDLMIVNGRWRAPEPRVPVSDGAGEVVAVGAGVSRVAVGDRVAGSFYPNWIDGDPMPAALHPSLGGTAADGVLAEYVCFDAEGVVKVPAHLSDEQAAALPCAGVTAWHAVAVRSGVKAGDTVLVQGTGGVSLFAAQFARAAGATVIATSGSDEKLARLQQLGVAHGINYRVTPDWDARVLELTDGRGVDHVVDVVGGENLNRSLHAVRLGGTVSLVGFLASMSGPVETFLMAEKNVRLYGILVGSRAMFEQMNDAISTHGIQPVVDRVYDLAETAEALRHLESAANFGKVCIRL